MKAEPITGAVAHHGEGPIWDERGQRVRWVDMLRGDILSMDPTDGAVERLHVGAVAAAMRPRASGGLVVAVERGFALLAADGRLETLPEVWSDASVRMNDGACDPQGRFYCGSMAYDMAPGRGALYRLDPDRSVTTVLTDLTISNGLAWRADGATALYVDSPTRGVDLLDFDAATGTLSNRRPFVTIEVEGDVVPDGIALDGDGGVWVALWGGSAVHRYDERGRLSEVVDLPVRHVSACALDPDGRLYVTTSADGGDTDAHAGALFAAEVGATAAPIGAFVG
jgi:sugar lactone lactonase YvrE